MKNVFEVTIIYSNFNFFCKTTYRDCWIATKVYHGVDWSCRKIFANFMYKKNSSTS